MKQKIFFVVGILVVAAIAIIAIRAVSMRSPQEGDFRVDSQPEEASVFLDDKPLGKTPLGKTPLKVTVGEHTVKVSADSASPALATWTGKVTVRQNALSYVNVTLSESDLSTASEILWLEKTNTAKSEVSVMSNPDGASVLLDDEMKGFAPITVSDLPAGQHTLTITSRGFINRTVKIRTTAGYRLMASVKLALSPGGDVTPTPSASDSATVSTTPTVTPKGTPSPTAKAGTPTVTPKTTPVASATDPAKPYVLIKESGVGYVNVRKGPSVSNDKIDSKPQVHEGEKYAFLDEKDSWFEIQATATESGWISAKFGEKVE